LADNEQNEGLDSTTARLLEEPDLLRDGEEAPQCAMRKVDDRDGAVAGEDAVEQRHLAAGIADVGDGDDPRQIIGELRALIGKIEGRHIAAIDQVEFNEEPCQQRLADPAQQGADDVERRRAAAPGRTG